ncbi:hypothetical protein LTR66_009586 [Elasticomyces elasticus]|nr:hypothetical protein LTR66_009586 [Elasticomyces elasticus]
MSDLSRLKSTIFVSGLTPNVSTQTLQEAFIPFGEIVDISLPKPELASNPDPHRGFGYIEFESASDAREAIDNMHESEVYGRVIRVTHAKEKAEKGEGLGSRVAVWEQEGYATKYAVSDEDRLATTQGPGADETPADAMQGLEQLDIAGPRLA